MTQWEDFIKAIEYGREIQFRVDMESTPRASFLVLGLFLGFACGWAVYGV